MLQSRLSLPVCQLRPIWQRVYADIKPYRNKPPIRRVDGGASSPLMAVESSVSPASAMLVSPDAAASLAPAVDSAPFASTLTAVDPAADAPALFASSAWLALADAAAPSGAHSVESPVSSDRGGATSCEHRRSTFSGLVLGGT